MQGTKALGDAFRGWVVRRGWGEGVGRMYINAGAKALGGEDGVGGGGGARRI